MKITQEQIIETIAELKKEAKELESEIAIFNKMKANHYKEVIFEDGQARFTLSVEQMGNSYAMALEENQCFIALFQELLDRQYC